MPIDEPGSPLALTMGDPSGIGADITLSLWQRRQALDLPRFFVLSCPALLAERAHQLGIDVSIIEVDPSLSADWPADRLAVAPLEHPVKAEAGAPDSANAPATIEAIERAVALVFDGTAAAVVTNPIAKAQLYEAGFTFPGHTEFLAELAGRRAGAPVRPIMMLAGPLLRAVPVTIHIPLRGVPERLTTADIVETGSIVATDLASRFAVERPRLAVAGLNPHAGESGALGKEDQDVVAPAVNELKKRGIDAFGPLPADTMFHDAARKSYDAALCMYHDQALIPAKALGFDDTVNVTLGLPFIRTSPDHGTAFDIAGKGVARADSLLAALRLARTMADNTAESPNGGN